MFLAKLNHRHHYEYMISERFVSKEKAVELRKSGLSIRKIENKLKIPRSTLSGWFKDIKLTESQINKLQQDWRNSLNIARQKAAATHRIQRKKRIALAKEKAIKTLSRLDDTDTNILELALAILYLGEGSKKTLGLSLGSSDPLILRLFIYAIQKVYAIDVSKIKADLHLRADQNANTLKKRWSQELNLPIENFGYVSIDQRTRGSKTYPTYYGVCQLKCGNADIQRRLIFLSRLFCSKVTEGHLGVRSSVG